VGSVKDLKIFKKPRDKKEGVGQFAFSDRYSVFDWGEMPDHIENKGAALCLMGAYCMEKAEKEGIVTHYLGLVTKKGKIVRTNEVKEPLSTVQVKLVKVIRPPFNKGKYDYSAFSENLVNFLVPLEIIYRNGLPVGSSVFKRLEKGDLTIKDLGLDHYPKAGERFIQPFFDVSTKLEERDRYISWQEAQKISGLNTKEMIKMKNVLLTADKVISQVAKKAGLVNEDGKIELAYDSKRELMLVDVLGTLDECRFTYQGQSVSKEVARQFYKKTAWYKDLEEAEKKAAEKGVENWKGLCQSKPPKLDPDLKKLISQFYMSTANAFLEKRIFDSPDLKKVLAKYVEYLERNKSN